MSKSAPQAIYETVHFISLMLEVSKSISIGCSDYCTQSTDFHRSIWTLQLKETKKWQRGTRIAKLNEVDIFWMTKSVKNKQWNQKRWKYDCKTNTKKVRKINEVVGGKKIRWVELAIWVRRIISLALYGNEESLDFYCLLNQTSYVVLLEARSLWSINMFGPNKAL